MKALHDRHRENGQVVLMRPERTAQHICRVPDHGRFFRDVRADGTDPVIAHIGDSSVCLYKEPAFGWYRFIACFTPFSAFPDKNTPLIKRISGFVSECFRQA